MVILVLSLQPVLVKRFGEDYNHFREAVTEGQSFPEAEASS